LKDLILNNLYRLGAADLLRQQKKNAVTVLSLHRISNERNTFWNPIKPSTFEELLKYAKRHYRVVSFQELDDLKSNPTDKPILILSFDDGYYDFYEHALPLLVKHDLPSNHNIVNVCADSGLVIWTERLNVCFEHAMKNHIDLQVSIEESNISLQKYAGKWMPFYIDVFKRLLKVAMQERTQILADLEAQMGVKAERKMMNWDQIIECSRNHVEIGSHSYNHDSLGTINDKTELSREINTSKQDIEAKLGMPINVFALPNGQTGALADEVLAASDYRFILYANDRLTELRNKDDRQWKISRINLIDEPFQQMALRMELFHQKLRRNG